MSQIQRNPRSTLHALIPYGKGTSEVESLVSYFCRLAASHSVSTLVLSRTIAEHFEQIVAAGFDWHERQIAGIRESAFTWSAGLSALTSVQGLDRLTFLPWREVISQNGLSIVKRGQFCSACFAEDIECGRQPYFRLAWESAEVSVCSKHGQRLTRHCQHCGKDNVRHAAAFVVPGWCTHCGVPLAKAKEYQADVAIEPDELWRARQVGELLASQESITAEVSRNTYLAGITRIITELHKGHSASFARRIGIAKSTVHHWFKGDGTPTLAISMKIAAHHGTSLKQLLTGDLSDWQPPMIQKQLVLQLSSAVPKPHKTPREIDWLEIEKQLSTFLLLPTPISVLEAARRLDLEARQLYLRANKTTRQLGERWKTYLKRRQESKVIAAWPYLEVACLDLWAEGKAVTRREIVARVPEEILSPVANLLNVLKEVQAHLQRTGENENTHT
ncbi:helix-turn-helix domain-containing protein [Herminiimonas fonticola]|uniref:Bacteriophage CI repressor-like protein n=1 Tax=Herminiimonas fonticola TaxID=303380 RepID=A0A4R6GKM4_9BURK|nr:helix-turn-helix domain-containing protein [Herminiimonas fonticola]RBA25654.1 TniQ [Herminiimonas fonticola]TDN94765.1 bacteriophage CI repressor-like protein [Herminiimonas fonticola]